jgi:hypothetical protein
VLDTLTKTDKINQDSLDTVHDSYIEEANHAIDSAATEAKRRCDDKHR